MHGTNMKITDTLLQIRPGYRNSTTVILLYFCFIIVVTLARATLFIHFAFRLVSLCCFCVLFAFLCFAFTSGTFAVEREVK